MAIEIADTALTETYPRSDRRRYPILVIRGLLLLAMHEHSGDDAFLAAALYSAQEARIYISRSDFARLDLLEEWADSLRTAHSRKAEPALLSEAAHVLGHMSDIHVMQHHLSHDRRHLDVAVLAARDALALSSAGQAERAFALGLVLLMRRSHSDVEEAESHFRAALTGLPHDDRRHAQALQCIAMARQMRA